MRNTMCSSYLHCLPETGFFLYPQFMYYRQSCSHANMLLPPCPRHHKGWDRVSDSKKLPGNWHTEKYRKDWYWMYLENCSCLVETLTSLWRAIDILLKNGRLSQEDRHRWGSPTLNSEKPPCLKTVSWPALCFPAGHKSKKKCKLQRKAARMLVWTKAPFASLRTPQVFVQARNCKSVSKHVFRGDLFQKQWCSSGAGGKTLRVQSYEWGQAGTIVTYKLLHTNTNSES